MHLDMACFIVLHCLTSDNFILIVRVLQLNGKTRLLLLFLLKVNFMNNDLTKQHTVPTYMAHSCAIKHYIFI